MLASLSLATGVVSIRTGALATLAGLGWRGNSRRLAGGARRLGKLRTRVHPVRLVLSLANCDQHCVDPARGCI
jgi:hypothetical protein